MNYYSPYFGYAPYTSTINGGIIKSLFGSVKNINWSGLLSNIQKTLGIVNQTIPMVKQVSPIINNAKTMFKIMNEFKKADTPVSNNTQNVNNQSETINSEQNINNQENNTLQYNNQPTFFL